MSSIANEPGISITFAGVVGVMSDFRVTFHRAGFAPRSEAQRMLNAATVTAWAILRAKSLGWPAKWITGSSVDKKTARQMRVKIYARMPGAGRPRKPDGEKFVPLPAEVHPRKLEEIKSAAKKSGRSIGEEISSRFP